jgi:hypothetical protein
LHAGADVDHQTAPTSSGAHEGVDRIVDEHEVARLAPVAVDDGPFAFAGRSGEGRDHAAVGPLTGAVQRREGEDRELHVVLIAIDRQQLDQCAPAYTLHRLRCERPPFLHRQLARRHVAVKRQRVTADDHFGYAGAARRFEHVGTAGDHDVGDLARAGTGRRCSHEVQHVGHPAFQ